MLSYLKLPDFGVTTFQQPISQLIQCSMLRQNTLSWTSILFEKRLWPRITKFTISARRIKLPIFSQRASPEDDFLIFETSFVWSKTQLHLRGEGGGGGGVRISI